MANPGQLASSINPITDRILLATQIPLPQKTRGTTRHHKRHEFQTLNYLPSRSKATLISPSSDSLKRRDIITTSQEPKSSNPPTAPVSNAYFSFPPYEQALKPRGHNSIKACFCTAITKISQGVQEISSFYVKGTEKWDSECKLVERGSSEQEDRLLNPPTRNPSSQILSREMSQAKPERHQSANEAIRWTISSTGKWSFSLGKLATARQAPHPLPTPDLPSQPSLAPQLPKPRRSDTKAKSPFQNKPAYHKHISTNSNPSNPSSPSNPRNKHPTSPRSKPQRSQKSSRYRTRIRNQRTAETNNCPTGIRLSMLRLGLGLRLCWRLRRKEAILGNLGGLGLGSALGVVGGTSLRIVMAWKARASFV